MGNMVQRAKTILGTNEFTALYDKGYHTRSELKTAQGLGIETIVAIPDVPSTSQAPDHAYNYENFKYDPASDTYTCPQGEALKTNGKWYKTHGRRNILISFKQYKTRACRSCPVRMKCTRSKTGRLIERSIYAENYEKNRKNILEKEHLYRRRQAIAEHPFGTIKRQWGFSYILSKEGINRASADVGFMFIAYFIRSKYNHRLKRFKLTGKTSGKKVLRQTPVMGKPRLNQTTDTFRRNSAISRRTSKGSVDYFFEIIKELTICH